MLALESIFKKYIPSYCNETVSSACTLLFLIWNITLGRQPLYELSQWMSDIDPGCHGLNRAQVASFNDDRFGRALDKLYAADRATLMTEIVVKMIKKINLEMARLHNDSTTVKAYGKIAGVTKDGLRMAKGNNKDHRPDLVHLVFSLTISSDGAIPVHYKTYAGNRTDDTTHIETWNTVKKIAGRSDFVYVADSKVCTSCQLSHIVSNGGRVITVLPNTYKETKIFKDKLLNTNIPRKIILKRKVEEGECNNEYFSLFLGNYKTIDDGYVLYWYLSSQKKTLDKHLRQKRVSKADSALLKLSAKLNKRDLITQEAIKDEAEAILNKYSLKEFFTITVSKESREIRKKIGKGRPGPSAEYKSITKTIYLLDWEIDEQKLKKEERADGIFPLLSTEKSIGPKEALLSYKYQPRLEKRFNQFKSVHEAAPILFKNIQRVEA